MSEEKGATGRCLCGKVSFRISTPVKEVGACHCSMCRRWGSGPFLEVSCGDAVVFEGGENIVRYKSSDWAERGFCGICGTNLFYFLVSTGDYMMAAGALDDQTGLTLESEVFIDEKPDFYTFANETKTMTGAEVFALYGPEEGE